MSGTPQIWAVLLEARRGLRTEQEVKYVRATTRQGAERTALANTWLDNAEVVDAHLATPEELGCTAVPA
jgi:hypothetical protein